jgi:cytochrome c biogenesis protein
VIASVLIAVAGVSASLYVRPRRLWLRATEQEDGTLRIEVAGLDRAESATGLDDDVAALAAAAGADTAAPTTPADESPTMQEDAP